MSGLSGVGEWDGMIPPVEFVCLLLSFLVV